MKEPAILCHQLRKTYYVKGGKVDAVNGLDLEVQPGECFGLLGPNGAGKTTTIEVLEGLLEATSGDVHVLGMKWSQDAPSLRRRIGISLQETRLPEKLKVQEIVRLFRSFYPQGFAPEQVITEVGLDDKKESLVENLSGGQRQRLAVACALVSDPELLFMDEPTTGLDPQSRLQLWESIRRMRSRGRTVLLTTHYMDEAEKLCDRVAIIDYGRVIALGSPRDLIVSISGDHVIEFELASANHLSYQQLSLDSIPSVTCHSPDGSGIQLTVREPHQAIPELLARVQGLQTFFTRLTTRQASLEDVFVKLTGRHLRDEHLLSS